MAGNVPVGGLEEALYVPIGLGGSVTLPDEGVFSVRVPASRGVPVTVAVGGVEELDFMYCTRQPAPAGGKPAVPLAATAPFFWKVPEKDEMDWLKPEKTKAVWLKLKPPYAWPAPTWG